MRIVWDEPKRRANLAKHGFDFAALTEEFFDLAVIRSSRDRRMLALGWFEDRMIAAVVFRPLGSEAFSIISMRPASEAERRFHERQRG